MIGLAVRCLVVYGVFVLPMTRGIAVELEIGSRFPAEQNERIVVKNDASVRNETASFAFGEVCYSSDQFRTWFVVMRIVGEQVLVEFEASLGFSVMHVLMAHRLACLLFKRGRG